MRRQHKDHTALAAQERGSAAWKARLRKRALNRVDELRRQALEGNRGVGRGRGPYLGGASGGMTRVDMQRIIMDEWDAMDVCPSDELDAQADTTLSGDLPPLTHEEYEDLMLAMYEQLQMDQGKYAPALCAPAYLFSQASPLRERKGCGIVRGNYAFRRGGIE